VNIPDDLTELDQWVVWNHQDGTKVPYSVHSGRRASTLQPKDWSTFEDAQEFLRTHPDFSGLGFVFVQNGGLAGIDLDDCIDEKGNLKAWAGEVLGQCLTYSEISPSGRGIKLFLKAKLPGPGAKAAIDALGRVLDNPKDPARDGQIELYDRGRYFTVTGQVYGNSPLAMEDCQSAIDLLYEFLRSPSKRQATVGPRQLPAKAGEGERHNLLMHTAASLRGKGLEAPEILAALKEINRTRCTPPKPDKEVEDMVRWVCEKPAGQILTNIFRDKVAPEHLNAEVDQAIEKNDLVRIYELAPQIAALDTTDLNILITKLQAAFPRQFRTRDFRESIKAERAKLAVEQLKADRPGLQPIYINNRFVRECTDASLKALQASNNPPTLFVRSGEMVRIEVDEEKRPSIVPVDGSHLRGRLDRSANYMKATDSGGKPVPVPLEVVHDIMSLPSEKWGLPAIVGVAEVPTLRKDGSLLDEPGYDAGSGLYYLPESSLGRIDVPEAPMIDDVEAAIAMVEEAIGEFPFVDATARANLFGLLLTPIVRPTFAPGCVPVVLIDAPAAGTGKSLLVDVVSMIISGRPAVMTTYPRSDEEMQKQIFASLLAGRQFITFDNLEGKLGSPALASVLTSNFYENRVLGISKVVVVPNLATWVVTGNNIQPAGDIPRRCCPVRLDARMSTPSLGRTFKHKDLRGWVKKNRAELLRALLIIARYWFSEGQPSYITNPLGSFEGWHRTIGSMLAHAGIEGFMGSVQQFVAESDEAALAWEDFLVALADDHFPGGEMFTVAELINRISSSDRLKQILPEPIASAYVKQGKSASLGSVIGQSFGRRRDRRFGDIQIHLQQGKTTRTRAASWRVIIPGYTGTESELMEDPP
jgi:hypothetical protein